MFNQNVKFHNKFVFEITDTNDNVLRTVTSYNVVLDQLWTSKLYNSGRILYRLAIGDGIGVPSASDTELFNKIADYRLQSTTRSWSYDDLTLTINANIYLDENTANGYNISEVGIIAESGNKLATHSTLQDMNGNPIVINKTSTTRIRIYASVYLTISPQTTNIRLYNQAGCPLLDYIESGLSGDSFIVEAAGIRQGGGTSNPYFNFGNFVNKTDPLKPKEVIYETSVKTSSFGTAQGNYAGGIVLLSTTIGPLYLLDDWFVGDRITGEALGTGDGVNKVFKTKFTGCINPTIYIDGVIVSGYKHYKVLSPYVLYPSSSVFYGSYFFLLIDPTTGETITSNRMGSSGHEAIYKEKYNVFKYLLYDDGVLHRCTMIGEEYSNDLIHWAPLVFNQEICAKYFRWDTTKIERSNLSMNCVTPSGMTKDTFGNIVFNTPPPSGSVITIDYNPKALRKTSDNTMTLQLSGQVTLSPSGV